MFNFYREDMCLEGLAYSVIKEPLFCYRIELIVYDYSVKCLPEIIIVKPVVYCTCQRPLCNAPACGLCWDMKRQSEECIETNTDSSAGYCLLLLSTAFADEEVRGKVRFVLNMVNRASVGWWKEA